MMLATPAHLIIIRGNSGSGKTTLAQFVQAGLPGAMLISQDVIRRDMLGVADKPNNLSIDAIANLAEFGRQHCPFVIVEGIMAENRYGKMLRQLIANFSTNARVYYFDLTLAETTLRHARRAKNTDFGVEKLAQWFLPHDVLNVPGEIILSAGVTLEDIAAKIIARELNTDARA